ncbi:MAG: hypothetical protein MI975_06420 [Cytophagales bacterium]|nr:hypothetical protein [Cytophagales bacterium]
MGQTATDTTNSPDAAKGKLHGHILHVNDRPNKSGASKSMSGHPGMEDLIAEVQKKDLDMDFSSPKKEAKALFGVYNKMRKKGGPEFSAAIAEMDVSKIPDERDRCVAKLLKYMARSTGREAIDRKEFTHQYTHLAKFADKYKSLRGAELIQHAIDDRNSELIRLNATRAHPGIGRPEEYDNYPKYELENLTKALLRDHRFSKLNRAEKNELIGSLNTLRSADKRSLDRLMMHGDYHDLEQVLGKGDVLNDSSFHRLRNFNFDQLKADLDRVGKEDVFTQKLLGQSDIQNWQHGGMSALPQLNGQVMKSEILNAIESSEIKANDSLSQYSGYIKAARNGEAGFEGGVEELKLKESAGGVLPNNTYVDIILGYSRGVHSVLNLSPNIGYEFIPDLSGGLGITFQHTFDKDALINSVIGYKLFGKYEMFGKRLFLLAESVFLIPELSYIHVEEEVKTFESTILVGAGYALNVFRQKVLSLSLHHNFNDRMPAPALSSPWLMRFGINLF